MSHCHVIGGGLAGLSAALTLCAAGREVTVHEAAAQAGGRCRSYFDRELGIRVDNGNHLLLSGNEDAMAYIDRIDARGTLKAPGGESGGVSGGRGKARFPFMDLKTGQRWTLRPNRGRTPWWIFSDHRRVPNTTPIDYLRLLALTQITDDRSVAEAMAHNTLYSRLIEPLAVSALNTRPEKGLARLLGAVIRESLMRGGSACVPLSPVRGWSESLIDPALHWLALHGGRVLLGSRVMALDLDGQAVTGLRLGDTTLALEQGDGVVLAVPAAAAAALLPELELPDEFEAIVNLHYRFDAEPGEAGFIGLVGGLAEWVFVKPGHVSVTISAARAIVEQPADALAARVWPEVSRALGITGPLPAWRVVKEKRATFAATAAQDRLRPAARTGRANLVLAGDWTATGLPATIEGAIRSGRTAAELLLAA